MAWEIMQREFVPAADELVHPVVAVIGVHGGFTRAPSIYDATAMTRLAGTRAHVQPPEHVASVFVDNAAVIATRKGMSGAAAKSWSTRGRGCATARRAQCDKAQTSSTTSPHVPRVLLGLVLHPCWGTNSVVPDAHLLSLRRRDARASVAPGRIVDALAIVLAGSYLDTSSCLCDVAIKN
jgi:hypothetical protein